MFNFLLLKGNGEKVLWNDLKKIFDIGEKSEVRQTVYPMCQAQVVSTYRHMF